MSLDSYTAEDEQEYKAALEGLLSPDAVLVSVGAVFGKPVVAFHSALAATLPPEVLEAVLARVGVALEKSQGINSDAVGAFPERAFLPHEPKAAIDAALGGAATLGCVAALDAGGLHTIDFSPDLLGENLCFKDVTTSHGHGVSLSPDAPIRQADFQS